MANRTVIYRKENMEIKVDDPGWFVKAIIFLRGYKIKSVVDWGIK